MTVNILPLSHQKDHATSPQHEDSPGLGLVLGYEETVACPVELHWMNNQHRQAEIFCQDHHRANSHGTHHSQGCAAENVSFHHGQGRIEGDLYRHGHRPRHMCIRTHFRHLCCLRLTRLSPQIWVMPCICTAQLVDWWWMARLSIDTMSDVNNYYYNRVTKKERAFFCLS